ncbi:CHIA-like protein [Mya arenaria]|uniref:CHIA-like protein n=1 Tax=Mya arenaria TaxID=6604 RepID=A0ABY7FQN8_MYAAR|nr:CHIA-like protein [Mya arenaria]
MKCVIAFLAAFIMVAHGDGRKRVCYYSNWSQYRPTGGKFFPTDIDASLCTHLIYSFAKLNTSGEMDIYKDFNDLKKSNPGLKTLLAIGGWNAGSTDYSSLVAVPAKRRNFAVKAVETLVRWNFDGLDLDWEYPARRGGAAADKENFILWIKDILVEFNKHQPRLLLTAAVAAGKENIDNAYDIPEMARYLDFINLMSYDLHGGWEDVTGHNSPLYSHSGEEGDDTYLNMDWAANYWVSQGCPKEKLIVGLATYGRSFQLTNAVDWEMGAPAKGAGPQGRFTREGGFLAYFEVCAMLEAGATRRWEEEQRVPYLTLGDVWVGYDDRQSFIEKLEYIRDNDFGGAMIWNIDLDDWNSICASSGGPYPLMRLMEPVLGGYTPPDTTAAPTSTTLEPGSSTTQEVTETTTKAPTGPPSSDCSGLPEGTYFPDPSDCRNYFRCSQGRPVRSTCVESLRWNQGRLYCDWPANRPNNSNGDNESSIHNDNRANNDSGLDNSKANYTEPGDDPESDDNRLRSVSDGRMVSTCTPLTVERTCTVHMAGHTWSPASRVCGLIPDTWSVITKTGSTAEVVQMYT